MGSPTTLSNLMVSNPQIATFPDWTIPTLGAGDPGHYCVVAFVHSAENPINATSFDVDAIATDNPQVAQRNLHITTMAPMDQMHRLGFGFHDYIEFHNPSSEPLVMDFVFDFSGLPRSLSVAVQLTRLATRRGLKGSVVGGTPAEDLSKPHVGVQWLRDWSDRLRRELQTQVARPGGAPAHSSVYLPDLCGRPVARVRSQRGATAPVGNRRWPLRNHDG